MKYRLSQILAEKALAASGTEVIDLDVSDPISALLFEYKNTPGSNTMADHVAACLSKVELVDGSDVLFSLSGKQLHALDYYDNRRVPYTHLSDAIGVQQLLPLHYNFGRKLWDTQLALDPSRFRNPQLKITHNRLTSDASSSAHTLKIVGYLFDEKKISPSGFLMSKEIKAYTSGADGTYEYTDLQLDYALRKILIEAYDDAYAPWQVVNEVRLSEDNDKRVPVDEKLSTLMKLINEIYPVWREKLYAVLTATATDVYVTPSFDITAQGATETQGGALDVEAGVLHSPFALGADVSANAAVEITGFNPHSIVPLLFGDQDDLDDWYELGALGNLKLRLKAGTAGAAGAVKIVTQQKRSY